MPYNGRDIRFWYDNWTGLGPFRPHFLGPLDSVQDSWRACDVVLSPGVWNPEVISLFLDKGIAQTFESILVNPLSTCPDKLIWGPSRDGHFSAALTYNIS